MWKSHGETDKKGRPHKSLKAGTRRLQHLDTEGIRQTDYSKYHMTRRDLLEGVLLYIALDLAISYLFFESWIPFFILLPGYPLLKKELCDRKLAKQRREMKKEFLDAIQMLSSSLQVGYSIENAMKEAVIELKKIYTEDAIVLQEFELMVIQMSKGKNVEELLFDFGKRSAIDDIQSFAEVFATAKRSGGDLLSIIRNTSVCIRQKQETMQEIATCLSGKAMEQNVMSAIPIFMILYMKLTSPGFLAPVYGNLRGAAIMAGCLIVYIIAYFWGRSIVSIEV